MTLSTSSLPSGTGAPSPSFMELALLHNNIGVSCLNNKEHNYSEAQHHFHQVKELVTDSAERLAASLSLSRITMGTRANEERSAPKRRLLEKPKSATSVMMSINDHDHAFDGQAQQQQQQQQLHPLVAEMDIMMATEPAQVPSQSESTTSPPLTFQRSEYDEGMHVLQGGIPLCEEDFLVHHAAGNASSAQTQHLHHVLLFFTIAYNQGQVCHAQGECEAALSHYRSALRQHDMYTQQLMASSTRCQCKQYHPLKNTPITRALILRNIGFVYYERSQLLESLTFFNEALKCAKESECTTATAAACESEDHHRDWDMAVTLNCIGVLHFHMSDPEASSAMKFYLAALEMQRRIVAVAQSSTDAPGNGKSEQAKMVASTSAMATTLNNMGRVHYMSGDYESAMKVYQEALYIRRSNLAYLGEHHSLDVAATIYNTGQTYHQLGQLDEALLFYQEYLNIATLKFGRDHRDVAIMLRCIAQIYHEKTDYKKAETMYQEALQSAKAALGSLHPEVASTLNKLGNMYYEQGDVDKALEAYEEGLGVEQQVLEGDHPNITVTLSNIAQIWKLRGDHKQAIRHYKHALRIQQTRLGVTHPHLAIPISSIATIYYQIEQYDRALDLFQEALCLRCDAYGDENLDVSATLNSIGMVLFKKGHHELAMEAFTRSYQIRRVLLGEKHKDVAIIMHNMATIHLQRGDDDMALGYYKKTLEIEKAALGEDHIDVSLTLHHIGQMYQNKGQMDTAITYLNESLEIEHKQLGWNSVSVARSLNNLANMFMQTNQVEKSMDYFASALRIYRHLGQSDDSLIIVGLNLYTLGLVHPDAAASA